MPMASASIGRVSLLRRAHVISKFSVFRKTQNRPVVPIFRPLFRKLPEVSGIFDMAPASHPSHFRGTGGAGTRDIEEQELSVEGANQVGCVVGLWPASEPPMGMNR